MRACDIDNNICTANGLIHYWSENKLIEAANENGLALHKHIKLAQDLPSRSSLNSDSLNYFTALHFRKNEL